MQIGRFGHSMFNKTVVENMGNGSMKESAVQGLQKFTPTDYRSSTNLLVYMYLRNVT